MNLTRTQRNVFATLFCVGLLANIEKGMVGLVAPYLQDHDYMAGLGLQAFSASQVGLITTLFYGSFIVMTFGAGWFVDKFGYKKFVPACLAILAIGCLLFGLLGYNSTSAIFVLIPLARLVIGFGQAGYTNGTPPVIAKIFAPEQRGGIQGKVVATAGIGTILVYLVFVWIVKVDFRWVYFLMAALVTVAAVMFMRLVPGQSPEEAAAAAAGAAKKSDVKFSEAWTNRNTLVLALTLLLNNLVGVALLSWVNSMYRSQFHDQLVAQPWASTVILVMYGVTLLVATYTGADIIKKWFHHREKFFMLVCSAIGVVFLLGSVLIHNLWGSAVSMWLSNLFIMWAFSAILALPYRLIPLRIIGSAFAVINIGAFVGGLLQGYGIGAIVDATGGYTVAFVVLAALLVVGGLVPYLLKEPQEPLNPVTAGNPASAA